jgi:hypothetical protein
MAQMPAPAPAAAQRPLLLLLQAMLAWLQQQTGSKGGHMDSSFTTMTASRLVHSSLMLALPG